MAAAVARAANRLELEANRQAISAALDAEIEQMRDRYYATPEEHNS